MIPMMEHEIVKRTGWLTQEEFLDILAVAQATPGIFAVDMAGHIGHKLGGLRGAIIASVANVLPSFVIILILATHLLLALHRLYQRTSALAAENTVLREETEGLVRAASSATSMSCWPPEG